MRINSLLKTFLLAFLLVLGLAQAALAEEGRYIITRDENGMIIIKRNIPSIQFFKPSGTPILGAPEATMEQCIAYIKQVNPEPKLQCSLEELVMIYYQEASYEGVRPDLAIAQAIKETGFFNYGGDVVPEQNNYCGLGTTGGGVRGAYFESPRIGIRAQIQHLLAYSTERLPIYPIVDPRYELLKKYTDKFAKCSSWESLNGNWAVPGIGYGESIVRILDSIKSVNPEDLVKAKEIAQTVREEVF